MYWRIGSLPELEHLSDERRRALLKETKAWRAYVQMIAAAVLAGFLFGTLGAMLLITATMRYIGLGVGLLIAGCIPILLMVVFYQLQMLWVRSTLRRAVVEASRGEALPMCLRCGYSLVGVQGNRCPECGLGIVVKESDDTGHKRDS